MYLRVKYLVALLLVSLMVACNNEHIYDNSFSSSEAEVANELELRFGVPATRATLDENLNLRWQRGDRIVVMAYNGSEQVFSKEASFWANQTSVISPENAAPYTQAYFKTMFAATEDAAKLQGVTKCYAVSPAQGVTVDGNYATMTIPDLQTGEYEEAPDFMTAYSDEIVGGLTLSTGENDDYVNDVNLSFTHHTHAFRVVIGNNMLGQEVVRAYVKFPCKVVGDLKVDYTTGEIVETNNTSDLVIVKFNEPKTAGDEFWVFINGIERNGEVDIRFQTDDESYTERKVVSFSKKNWVAGAVSRINNLPIPKATTETTLRYTLSGVNNLGEDLESLHLKLSGDYYFTNFSDKATVENKDGVMDFTLFSDMVDDNFRNIDHSLVFESKNALIPKSQPKYGSSLKVNAINDITPLDIPYLFAEDFSQIPTFDDEHDNPKVGGGSDTYVGITELSTKTSALAGWYATRIGTQKETSVRICCRHQNVAKSAYYKGRLYTPFMANIKEGKNVNITVSFKYGGSISEGGLSKPKAKPKLYFGLDGQETVLNMDNTDLTAIVTGGGYMDQAPTSLAVKGIDGEDVANSGGSYTSFPFSAEVEINDVNNKYRLAWIVSSTSTAKYSNGNYWLYLDDIKVSILKE